VRLVVAEIDAASWVALIEWRRLDLLPAQPFLDPWPAPLRALLPPAYLGLEYPRELQLDFLKTVPLPEQSSMCVSMPSFSSPETFLSVK
jgi:hypothetical protein